jgi:hypothetical protein
LQLPNAYGRSQAAQIPFPHRSASRPVFTSRETGVRTTELWASQFGEAVTRMMPLDFLASFVSFAFKCFF